MTKFVIGISKPVFIDTLFKTVEIDVTDVDIRVDDLITLYENNANAAEVLETFFESETFTQGDMEMNLEVAKIVAIIEFSEGVMSHQKQTELLDKCKSTLGKDQLQYVQAVAADHGLDVFYTASRETQAELGWL